MQGKSAGDADLPGPRPVVFGRRRADAQSGPGARGGGRGHRRLPSTGRRRQRPWRRHAFLRSASANPSIIDLPRDVKDVLVADPKIANAVIRSPQRAYIIGAAVGQTNVVFFDADGQQIAAYDIAVKRDLNGVRAALKQSHAGNPDRGRRRQRDADRLGVVPDRGAAGRRSRGAAGRAVPTRSSTAIVVRGRDQVMLKVTVAEVRRDIIKQMGVDLSASMNYGTAVVNFNNTNPFTANGGPLVPGNGLSRFGHHQGSALGHRHHARDGKRRRGADAGRTQSDGDLRQVRDLYLGRRISHSDRRDLPNDDVGRDRTMRPDRQLQEIRHLAQLHAGGADARGGSACG